jgi:hypothetical protein
MELKVGFCIGIVSLVMLSAHAEVLENEFVRLIVDPQRGGGVTEMRCKKAVSIPTTAERGAGVAGSGQFFVPLVQLGGKTVDLGSVALKAEKTGGGIKLIATLAPGLSFERTLKIDDNESGLRITDTYRNDGQTELELQVGAKSRQQPEPWRRTLRCWFGDTTRSLWQFTPYNAGGKEVIESKSDRVFWRVSGQYAVGFLSQVAVPQSQATLTHTLPSEKGNPAEFQWLSAPVTLPAGQSLTVSSTVLIDEGGREGNLAACADRVLVTADLRGAGHTGEAMPAFGTVVSAVPHKVKMVVSDFIYVEPMKNPARKVHEFDLTLEPGKAAWRHFEVTPPGKGLYYIEVAVLDENGQNLGLGSSRAVIDGADLPAGEFANAWKKYTQKLPEVHARGSWAEIGAQLAQSGTPGPLRRRDNDEAQAKEALAFYQKKFPFYAELITGAAGALNLPPTALLDTTPPAAASKDACMGVIFHGPDGVINAYSKERSGSNLNGLGYVKILPTKGYPYHLYTLGDWSFGYGVNSEGLCTSGASLNCNKDTSEAGKKTAAEWKQSGKRTAPLAFHMMMATCKNVEEALAFIGNSDAPLDWEGSMLIVDRAGNAALIEASGLLHNILRPQKGQLVFATGNSPHEGKGGLFKCGDNWGWAVNTQLRERFLEPILRDRKGQVSLKDAIWLMETHALPGGMCQHGFENPGSLYTSTSYIGLARTSELYISHGPPCRVRYERYTLKE